MKAMTLTAYNTPLVLTEVPDPTPGSGEVQIRMRACGVCRTDLKIIQGQHPSQPSLPHILGHEPAGEISAVGPDVTGLRVGDRVAVTFYTPCGDCPVCRSGYETSCPDQKAAIGFRAHGGFGEYMVAPARNVAKLAADVPYEHGAIIADAIATPLQGLRDRVRVQPGETVVILGAGGLGLHAIQILNHLGARSVAVDLDDAKLSLSATLGASATLSGADPDLAEKVRGMTEGVGADVVVDLVGGQRSYDACLTLVRSGGRLLILGYKSQGRLDVAATDIVGRQIAIIGNRAANEAAFRDAVELVNTGIITPIVTHTFPLDAANEALARLDTGDVIGRAVLMHG